MPHVDRGRWRWRIEHAAFALQVDGVESSAGRFERQNPGAFSSSSFDGPFVFFYSGYEDGAGDLTVVGRIVGDGEGAITEGDQDIRQGAAYFAQIPLTGTFAVDDTTGRGLATLTNMLGIWSAQANERMKE